MATYCLDSNFFIQAWNKYYSPEICKDYWEIIEQLAKAGRIIVPEMVYSEIENKDDSIKDWLSGRSFMISKIDESVQKCLIAIYDADPSHKRLVDSTKQRSIADPWVIAHALAKDSTVVTKEDLNSNPNSSRIKIPNVCRNMGIRCINDFEFIKEVGISFTAILDKK